MGAQTLLQGVVIVGGIIWLIELAWLYRQARLENDDPIARVSGAAIFFVLAVPVAVMAPDLIDRVAAFWERVVGLLPAGGDAEKSTPRLIVGGKTVLLTQERIRIGRYPNNDLVLDHPTVSAYHAEIILRPDGRHELMDRDSRNGTRINGTTIRSAVLRDGDQVTLGAMSLHYLSRSATERGLEPRGIPAGKRRFG